MAEDKVKRSIPVKVTLRRRILGVRVSAFVEIVVFLVVALICDRLFGAGNRLVGLQPHPFWLIVLLVTVQYGTKEGLLAAVFATIALRLGNIPAQGLDQSFESWLIQLALVPVLWFAAALVFGELQMRHLREREELEGDLHFSREREIMITRSYDQLAEVKDRLEASVAGQLQTVLSIYRAARAIERFGTGEVLVGIAELVRQVLNPPKFSLFLLNRQMLEAAVNEGWSADDSYQPLFDANSVLFEAVVARRQILAAVRPQDEFILAGEGVLAGPLISLDTGEIVGMLKVEQVDFVQLTPTTIQNFGILCEWIGTAFANARRYEESRKVTFFDPLRNLLSANFFEQQRSIIKQVAQRLKFNVSALYLRVDQSGSYDADQRVAIARMVSAASGIALRTTDLRFDYRHDGWDYAVILVGTGSKDALIALEKLTDALETQLADANIVAQIAHSIEVVHQCP